MFNIVLYQPEIPPNTGNIIRLAANMGAKLHLIGPLGFEINDKHLKRAGLDYISSCSLQHYDNFDDILSASIKTERIFLCSTKAKIAYSEVRYCASDTFVFGPESRGLPACFFERFPESQAIRIPMVAESRSLNLSNAVAIILYEAWRQLAFNGSDDKASDI